jgi:Glucose-6-phosphate dehydrogenase, C-terminal domain
MLLLQVQPEEGITLRFGEKVPGRGFEVRTVSMDFLWGRRPRGLLDRGEQASAAGSNPLQVAAVQSTGSKASRGRETTAGADLATGGVGACSSRRAR